MSLKRDTVWSAVAAVVVSIGRLAVMAVLSRQLDTEEFGRFIFLQWLIGIVFLLGSFGLPGIATRYFAQFRVEGVETYAGFSRWFHRRSWQILLAIAITTPTVATIFGGTFEPTTFAVVSLWAASNGALTFSMARAQGLQRFRRVAATNALLTFITLAGVLVIPHASTALPVMLVFAFGSGVAALACAATLRPTGVDTAPPGPPFSPHDITRYGINIWITAVVAALVWQRAELSVVRSLLSATDVAHYGAALTLASIAYQAVGLLTGALSPKLAEYWGRGAMGDVVRLTRIVTDMLLLFSAMGVGFLACFSNQLIVTIFGAPFLPGSNSLVLLALGAMGLTVSCLIPSTQYQSNGVFARNVNLIGAVSLIGLAIPCTYWLGILGAALSRCLVQLAIGIATFWYARRFISAALFSVRNVVWFGCLTGLLAASAQMLGNVYTRVVVYLTFLTVLAWVVRIGEANMPAVLWAHRWLKMQKRLAAG